MSPASSLVRDRLGRAFAAGRPALICYLALGDPALPRDAVERYVDAGVDVLEIGVPVPNPYLDGAVVRDSMRRSLGAGATPERLTETTAGLRAHLPEQAMVWMSYGPVVAAHEWVGLSRRAGIDGLLFPESARHFSELRAGLEDAGVHLCQFLGRDLPDADVRAARCATGYVMLQAVPTHTGEGDPDRPLPDSTQLIDRLRCERVTAPVALGIGISTPAQARQAADMGASGVVVGTAAIVHALRGGPALSRFLGSLRAVL